MHQVFVGPPTVQYCADGHPSHVFRERRHVPLVNLDVVLFRACHSRFGSVMDVEFSLRVIISLIISLRLISSLIISLRVIISL